MTIVLSVLLPITASEYHFYSFLLNVTNRNFHCDDFTNDDYETNVRQKMCIYYLKVI
jgi:hypothetical protein